MEIKILGRVRLFVAGIEVDLGAPSRRIILAALALANGQPVPVAQLADMLWPGQRPGNPRHVIQTHIHRLRQLVDPHRARRAVDSVVRTVGDGYLLDSASGETDIGRFRDAVRGGHLARQRGDHEWAVATLTGAVQMWARPLSCLPDLAEHPAVVGLNEEYFQALIQLAESALHNGTASEVLALVEAAAGARPLDELAQATLIRCLHAAGRPAEAIARYRDTYRNLAAELGVSPGRVLTEAFTGTLASMDATVPPPPPPAQPVTATGTTAPANAHAPVPRPPAHFTGRVQLLLDISTAVSKSPNAVVAVAGGPGVGKTALVTQWAQDNGGNFPDHRLYVDFAGYSSQPLSTLQAAVQLLRGIRVQLAPPADLPAAISALWHQVTGTQTLIILDNVAEADTVRPLLPALYAATTIVVSRVTMVGLVALNGAHPVEVRTLDTEEAIALLTSVIGAPRVNAEALMARDLAELCGHLPLALRVVGARLACRPDVSLADDVAALRSADLLRVLEVDGDPAASVSAAFAQSYHQLSADAQTLFRVMGSAPTRDASRDAVAALAGAAVADIDLLLQGLVEAHLVEERGSRRYAVHDLLAVYATRISSPSESAAAAARWLDWLTAYAYRAKEELEPGGKLSVDDARSHPSIPALSRDDALRWYTAEQQNLTLAIMHAAAARSPISWQLLTFCQLQFRRGGHLHDWMLAADAVREAANELGDTQGQLLAIIAQATSRHYASRYADAVAFAGHARALAAELGDRSREASAATVAGLAHWQGGQLTEASHDFADVVERIDPQTSPAMLAVALNNIGMIEQERGYVSRAMSNYRQALEINQRIRRQAGIVSNLANIAWASFDSNDFAESAAIYVSALTELSTQQHVAGEAIIREDYTYTLLALDRVDEAAEQAGAAYEAAARANDPRMQASTAIAVASVQRRQGRYEEAMAHLKQAYATATELQSRRPMAMAQIELARLACAREKPGDAIIHGRQAHDIAAAAGFGLLVAHAHVVLATAMRAAGHLLQAAEHDELAMRQRAQLGLAPKDNGSPLGPAVARQAHDNRWPPTGAIAPVGEPVEQRTRPHRSS